MTSRSPRTREALVSAGQEPPAQRATAVGTTRYRSRFAGRFASDYFRMAPFGVAVSSIGIGTYLGDPTPQDDGLYAAAIEHAVRSGVNVIDTSLNYRGQRSERAVGAALRRALDTGEIARDEVVICSKAGYIPLGEKPPASREEYRDYVRREFIDTEILQAAEIVGGGHSLAPRFLRYCLAKSRQNLGVRSIDVYYLHNPEQQAGAVGRDELKARIRSAFVVLEDAASRGEIGVYGCATWNGLRAAADATEHLELEDLLSLARDAGGTDHHFRAVQMPMNLAMTEAVRVPTQSVRGTLLPAAEAAAALELMVVGSATLMQGNLATGLPAVLADAFPDLKSDAQRAIAFARSVPGSTTALVGMRRVEHVDENLRAAER